MRRKLVMKTTTTKTSFSLKEQWQIFKMLIAFTKGYRGQFLMSFIAMAGVSGIAAYLPVVIQQYMDNYLRMGNATLMITIRVSLFYLVLTILKSIFEYVQNYLFQMASERTVGDIRDTLFDHVIKLGMRYFDQVPNGTVVSRVTNDTETIIEFWNVFLNLFNGLFNVIAVGIAMFTLDWELALMFTAFLPIILLLVYIYQRYSTRIYSQMRESLSRLNARLSESISGINIIQAFAQEKRMMAEFDAVNQEYVVARKAMFKMDALLLMPAINLIEASALALVLFVLGRQQIIDASVEIGVIYAFTSYSKSFFHPLGQMIDSLSIFQDGIVSGSRIKEVLNYQEMAPTSLPGASAHITDGEISVRDLSFSYDGEKSVLKNINFDVKPGQTLALVGQTGSGKSSIINVLMRFYEFSHGKVMIDGHDIKEIPIEELRAKMGLVLQDSFMFYGDIANNITLHKDYNDEYIQAAAQFVKADDFIRAIDGNYHARVIEGGDAFSTGQNQLISFARTIIREPKILILDEATANIDTATEQKIQSGLDNMRRGRTTIIIAHRLSTIKDADKILVLRHGEIIESGTHDELIAAGGTYHDMYQLQTYQKDE